MAWSRNNTSGLPSITRVRLECLVLVSTAVDAEASFSILSIRLAADLHVLSQYPGQSWSLWWDCKTCFAVWSACCRSGLSSSCPQSRAFRSGPPDHCVLTGQWHSLPTAFHHQSRACAQVSAHHQGSTSSLPLQDRLLERRAFHSHMFAQSPFWPLPVCRDGRASLSRWNRFAALHCRWCSK